MYLFLSDMDFNLDKPGVALGPWCFTKIYDYDLFQKLIESSLLPPPPEYASDFSAHMHYMDECTSRAAIKVGHFLNARHQTNFSDFFWLFTQRVWISHIAYAAYDLYLRLRCIQNINSRFEYASIKLDDTRPNTVFHLVNCLMRSQTLTAWIASYVLEQISLPNCRATSTERYSLYPDTGPHINALNFPDTPGNHVQSLRGKLKQNILRRIYPGNLLHANQFGTGFGKLFLLKLLFSAKEYRIDPIKLDDNYNLINYGDGVSKSYSDLYDEKFELLLYNLSTILCPKIFYGKTDFKDNLQQVCDLIENTKNKNILFPNQALVYDERTNIYVAFKKERENSTILMAQHGSYYGTIKKYQFIEQEEFEKSDIFLTWGWKKANGNFYPLPIFPNNYHRLYRAKKDDGSILFVEDDESINFYRLMTARFFAEQLLPIIKQKISFFKQLRKDYIDKVIYQKYPALSPVLPVIHFIKAMYPNLKITNENFQDHFSKSRIIVMQYPGTTMHFALAANAPTVLFWDKNLYVFSDHFQAIADRMHDCGILFYSAEDAAAQVNKIYDNPQKWLKDRVRQACIKDFVKNYAWIHKNPYKYYISFMEELNKILNERL